MNKAKLPLKLRSCCSVKTKTQKVAKVEKKQKKEKTGKKRTFALQTTLDNFDYFSGLLDN